MATKSHVYSTFGPLRANGLLRAGRFASLSAVLIALALGGCNQVSAEIPAAEVKTVEAYGVTLDPDASPQEVVYVLLKSIADDYAAARAKDEEAQRKAQFLTLAVAAPSTIEKRLVESANLTNPKRQRENLGPERDEKIFKTVHYWAPIVGHYVPTFADADLQTVIAESWVAIRPNGQTAHVFYPVSHDPDADPAEAETATIRVELTREQPQSGGPAYWRISRVQFLGRQFRAPALPQIVQAYGVTLDESASPEQVAAVALQTTVDMLAADKAKSKDERASALYRLFNLAHPSQVQARIAESAKPAQGRLDDHLTISLREAAMRWAHQVKPMLETAQQTSAIKPEQMHAEQEDGSDSLQVKYAPAGARPGAAQLTVRLHRHNASGKSFWRVSDVVGGVGPVSPESRQADTQANSSN